VRSLNEYNEMKQAMLRSEGALLYSDLLALHRSLQVFLGNCAGRKRNDDATALDPQATRFQP
jgi:hypothetical protein